jgi:hypothetical protein
MAPARLIETIFFCKLPPLAFIWQKALYRGEIKSARDGACAAGPGSNFGISCRPFIADDPHHQNKTKLENAMYRVTVPLMTLLLTACATPMSRQEMGCGLSPNPKALSLTCAGSEAARKQGGNLLCPGSLNPKFPGSAFCVRARK